MAQLRKALTTFGLHILGVGVTGVSPVSTHGRGRPCPQKMLKAIGSILVLSASIVLGGCRQDMHDQPRLKTYAMSDFYSDQRSERPPVEGTVARGQLHENTYLYTGKIGGNPGDYMPFAVTANDIERGRERFNIYCAPCHSRVGDGNGTVVQRGFKHPPTYHQDRLRKAPLGYFFDVMTNGFGAMPDYASQIPVEDRWRIVAYIRALQLSQNATQADVAGQQVPSAPPKFEEPGSGATLPTTRPESSYTGDEQK